MTVKVASAIVSVPCRGEPVFGATVKFTLAFPLPLEPDVMVIHETLLTACHGQLLLNPPELALTVTESDPPASEKFSLFGVSMNVHGGDAQHLKAMLLLVRPALLAVIEPFPLPLPV